MHVLFQILTAVIIVSLMSLVGIITLIFHKNTLQKILFSLVAFASGAMLGASFLDLLPEAVENGGIASLKYALLGIIIFFVFETFFYWYHRHYLIHHKRGGKECRCQTHRVKSFVYLNVFGDGLHNFIDGMIIAAGFLVSFPLGIITTLAVVFHEIPQEIGDFGLLIYGGLSRTKALLCNFASALTAILGALAVYFFAPSVQGLTSVLVPIAAGGFIYIATTDLLPELLHTERDLKKTSLQLALFFFGIFLIWILGKTFTH